MSFQILHASDPLESKIWDALIEQLPIERRDIHFTSNYGRVQEKLGHEAILAALTDDGGVILQPFIVRKIEGSNARDLCSPYGYGGPLSSRPSIIGKAHASNSTFQICLKEWASHHNVVTEFCRLHPMMAGHQFMLTSSLAQHVVQEKQVVFIALSDLSEATVARRVRRALKAMKDAAVVVQLKSDFTARAQFAMLYQKSMERKNAAKRWHFSRDYLDAHFDELSARIFYASDGIGSRLLMVIGGYGVAYAHLLASNGDALHSGLDEKLYYDAALKLRDDGYKLFHLGGGLTADASDKLLAFKRGFSQLSMQTFCYSRVFDNELYSRLIDDKARVEFNEHGRESLADYFPAYRREFA